MPTYFYHLHTPSHVIRDLVGSDLPDEDSARGHARSVAQELMRHREVQTRSWQLDVRDSEGRGVFTLLLATLDETLGHYSPELRSAVEDVSAKSASLSDTIRTVRRTLLEVKGTMARADRLPYIVAI